MAAHNELLSTSTSTNTNAGAAAPGRSAERAAAPEAEATPVLAVSGLTVSYGRQPVVRDVSFSLGRGESLALIGESGSGKTTLARTVLRLLPNRARILAGSVAFDGTDITALSDRRFRPFRGVRLGFVPQDPGNALNPVRAIGVQAHEAAALLKLRSRDEERARILEAFEHVGLPDPERVYRSYPHQLSGGMLQRVLIGLAVLPRPELIVADEPTSGLDVTIQKVVLDLFTELRDTLGIALLFITHDLAIAAERADSLVVLKDGEVQESGSSAQLFAAPRSDYTRELQADVPALNPDRYREVRRAGVCGAAIAAGSPDDAGTVSAANAASTIDAVDPASTTIAAGTIDAAAGSGRAGVQVELRNLVKRFHAQHGDVTAVDGVSLTIERGQTHALVGESGSGKTTTVRLLLGLEQPDSGEIIVAGQPVAGHGRQQWRAARRHLQLVYQNPFTSLDPTWKLERIVGEPLDRYAVGESSGRRSAVTEALEAVGLGSSFLGRRPATLSGGQRQRVAIARALVMRPDVLVLDEPTSALDVTVQAEIVALLVRLQAQLGLTYLFVSHDLSLVRQIADRVTVLQHGRVIESGTAEAIFHAPKNTYTRALLSAIPLTPSAGGAGGGGTRAAAQPAAVAVS